MRVLQPTRLIGLLCALLVSACNPPPAVCEPGVATRLEDCVIQWDCVDALQRVQCRAGADGTECACYVDGLPQTDGDGGAARSFTTQDDTMTICGESAADQIARVNEGCRWAVPTE